VKRLLPILLALAAIASARAEILEGKVIRISDGDTLVVLDASRKQHKIRVSGIDAPEKAQAFGNRARQHLASMAFGKPVTVEWRKRDKYGRIIGKVLANCDQPGCPLDAGLEQLKAGMAWWYRKYAGEQSAEDRERYGRAEQAARDGKLGLWRDPNPVPPWDWRKQHREPAK
jgi:endonuclease YncB( thermonuclease family)